MKTLRDTPKHLKRYPKKIPPKYSPKQPQKTNQKCIDKCNKEFSDALHKAQDMGVSGDIVLGIHKKRQDCHNDCPTSVADIHGGKKKRRKTKKRKQNKKRKEQTKKKQKGGALCAIGLCR